MSEFLLSFAVGFVVFVLAIGAWCAAVFGSMYAFYWISGGELWEAFLGLFLFLATVAALAFATVVARP